MKSKELEKNKKLNVFRLLRIARDKKVKDLAEELSVTPAYIHAIENGERFPADRLLNDYAQGVSVETILNFKPNGTGNNKFENILLSLLLMICKEER